MLTLLTVIILYVLFKIERLEKRVLDVEDMNGNESPYSDD